MRCLTDPSAEAGDPLDVAVIDRFGVIDDPVQTSTEFSRFTFRRR